MNALTKRLSLWHKHLAVMESQGIKSIRYSDTITITNTTLIKLIVVNVSNDKTSEQVNQIKSTDIFGLERIHKTMVDFEKYFEQTFSHLTDEINTAFNNLDVFKMLDINFDGAMIEYSDRLFKHPNTVEILSPIRADLKPGATMNISCPFEVNMVDNIIGVFFNKKSLFDKKIKLLATLIHSDFNGRPSIILTNESTESVEIIKGMAVAQVQFIKNEAIKLNPSFKFEGM